MDRARLPGNGFGDEAMEESARGGTDVVAALRMPLDAEDKVGAVGSLTAFHGFDDSVLRAASRDSKTVAGDADSLMMTGIDWKAEETILFGRFFGRDDGSKH